MRIDVGGGGDVTVAQPSLNILNVPSSAMEQCGYAVTQPVEENVRQAADFGPIPAARRSEMPGILKSRCGTPPYIAPRS